MPWMRLLQLEKLTAALEENIVLLQMAADFRADKNEQRHKADIADHSAIHQELDNYREDYRDLENKIGQIIVKLHQISNHIMSLGQSVEDLAEYMSILEQNQEQMKRKLDISLDE